MLNATDQLRFLRFIITAVNVNKDTLFVYDTQCHALFSLLKSENTRPLLLSSFQEFSSVWNFNACNFLRKSDIYFIYSNGGTGLASTIRVR